MGERIRGWPMSDEETAAYVEQATPFVKLGLSGREISHKLKLSDGRARRIVALVKEKLTGIPRKIKKRTYKKGG